MDLRKFKSTQFILKLIFCVITLQVINVSADDRCMSLFEINQLDLKGAQFLHQRNQTLYKTPAVEQMSVGRLLPAEKLTQWLYYLEKVYKTHRKKEPQVLNRLKKYYLDQFVTKFEDIPDSYFEFQKHILKERGHGDIEMNSAQRKQLAEAAIKDQKNSLETWIDYFFSKDADIYPMWTKYWSFTGMVKLAKYDPEAGTFGNRSAGSVASFPELNPEAFALVVDALVKKINGDSLESINDPVLIEKLQGANFGKLYGRALQIVTQNTINLNSIEGEWVTYKQGKNFKPLVESLKGMNTGWCTAGASTAKEQLAGGDFHVFYTKNENGEAKIPRIAIRMEGGGIAEVRGVAKDQNLDSEIVKTEILQTKLKEFGSKADDYYKKTADMKLLSLIESKTKAQQELSIEEVRFLYEIDQSIDGFGRGTDPRIAEIKNLRNTKKDIAIIFELKESEVSLTVEEAQRPGIKMHYGELTLDSLENARNLRLPEIIYGGLTIQNTKNLDGAQMPREVHELYLPQVESAKNMIMPEIVHTDIGLPNLTSAVGLKFPRRLEGSLDLRSITSAQHVQFPEYIKYKLILSDVKSLQNVVLPKEIGLDLYLNNVVNAKDAVLSEIIRGSVHLDKLEIADGLVLPKELATYEHANLMSMKNLKSARGMVMPDKLGVFLGLPKDIQHQVQLSRRIKSKVVFTNFKNSFWWI